MNRSQSEIGLLVLGLLFLLVGCGAYGQSDNASSVERARRGDYAEAAAGLESMVSRGDISPEVVESLYFSWIRQGYYVEARAHFEDLAADHPNAGSIRLAAGRANRLTGNPERALVHLDEVLKLADVGIAATHEKAIVLEEVGRRGESREIYTDLIERFKDGFIRGGNDLLYVAMAMWALEYVHDANDVFKIITQSNPLNAEAFLEWGNLLAEKYNNPEAVASYEDALEIDPNMPEAHLGIARVLANNNSERSQASLQKALDVNPNFMDARLLLAEQRINAEQYAEADEEIENVLEINPRSSKALALMATTRFLQSDEDGFNRYVQQVLLNNPLYGEMYYILADRSVSLRLYTEAVEFARQAILLDPNDWKARSLLGINLMRIGAEDEGTTVLEEAYEGDPFNVWTVNTLTLLDSFTNFESLETEHFRIKLHHEEKDVLAPYVTDLLEKAYRELSAKYRFEPEGPITFEMFPDHADFAVRTLGLPGLGALGVCFGKVIVMDSPSARSPETFNWGSTLWHEFAHVITLQITDHKIPRWFSEGISVYEERRGMVGWGDDLQMDYVIAIQEGQLLPVGELNNGFIRPKNPGQIALSYYQASLICDYIEEKHGFGAIRRMLALYKAGHSTVEVFQEALGVGLAQFDNSFLQWVDSRVKDIDVARFSELVLQGQQALEEEDFDQVIEVLNQALQLYPEYTDDQNAYEILAEAHLRKGNEAVAIEILQQFTSYSESAYATHLKLAGLMRDAGSFAEAREVLERALFIHPMDLEGHRELGALLLADEQFDEAANEYQVLLALNVPDLADTYFKLASAQYGEGKLAEARRSILSCLEIAPSFEAAQELLLKIVR